MPKKIVINIKACNLSLPISSVSKEFDFLFFDDLLHVSVRNMGITTTYNKLDDLVSFFFILFYLSLEISRKL